MPAEIMQPRSTRGFYYAWNGTKDDQGAFVDYSTGHTNINELKRVDFIAHDIRTLLEQPTMIKDGYQLLEHTSALTPDEILAGDTPEGRKVIEDKYYAECKKLIQDLTGEKTVVPYNLRIRQHGSHPREFSNSRVATPKMMTTSLAIPHVDRDPVTLVDGIEQFFGPVHAAELMRTHKRFAQVNVWRPIDEIVKSWPLLFINKSQITNWNYDSHTETITPLNDPRVAIRGAKVRDTVLKHDPAYIYHYASSMTRQEVYVFSSADTDPKMVTPHSAFWDESTPDDCVSRRSIEVRSWVFFEE